eukprot:TRINITY_DN59514_c0_g1_i1.p1 TRINITY_DN59514_c0_g1~~TRINITY_DN59514_c0_g1_i1.p1  ORF type:complete len:542 (+),score=55.35 TRINITY_DN59514_c0_g1_i1:158-1783(+)
MRRWALLLVSVYFLCVLRSLVSSLSWCAPAVGRVKGSHHAGLTPPLYSQPRRWVGLASGAGDTDKAAAETGAKSGKLPTLNSEIFRLSWPALCSALIEPILLLIDTIFIGRVSATALSATAAASELFTLTLAVSIAMRDGASSSIARERAAAGKSSGFGGNTAIASLVLAAVAGVAVSGLMCKGIGGLLRLGMGITDGSPLREPAVAYAKIRALGESLALTSAASEGIHRGLGDTRTPLVAAVIAGVVNVVLDYIFVMALQWGVEGAAGATVLAQACQCFWLLRSCRALGIFSSAKSMAKNRQGGASLKQRLAPLREALVNITSTNAAVLLKTMSVMSFWVFIASLVTRQVGAVGIAAHGVVLRLWLLFVLAAEAPAVAGQVLLARSLAADKQPIEDDNGSAAKPLVYSVRLLRRRLLTTALIVGFSCAGVMYLMTPIVAPIFTSDASTRTAITGLWPYACANVPIVMIAVMCEGALLGGGLYRYLGFSMLFNTTAVAVLSWFWMARASTVETAWACLLTFFGFRLVTSAAMAQRLTGGRA